jgi:hypothetical protein
MRRDKNLSSSAPLATGAVFSVGLFIRQPSDLDQAGVDQGTQHDVLDVAGDGLGLVSGSDPALAGQSETSFRA